MLGYHRRHPGVVVHQRTGGHAWRGSSACGFDWSTTLMSMLDPPCGPRWRQPVGLPDQHHGFVGPAGALKPWTNSSAALLACSAAFFAASLTCWAVSLTASMALAAASLVFSATWAPTSVVWSAAVRVAEPACPLSEGSDPAGSADAVAAEGLAGSGRGRGLAC